jgi:hypothetical protein
MGYKKMLALLNQKFVKDGRWSFGGMEWQENVQPSFWMYSTREQRN